MVSYSHRAVSQTQRGEFLSFSPLYIHKEKMKKYKKTWKSKVRQEREDWLMREYRLELEKERRVLMMEADIELGKQETLF